MNPYQIQCHQLLNGTSQSPAKKHSQSRHKLQWTENFTNTIKTVQIPDNYKLVSFDVKSLFTSIPLQLALDCTETAINNSTYNIY